MPLTPEFKIGTDCSTDPRVSLRTRIPFEDDMMLTMAAKVRLIPCADNSDPASCKVMKPSTPRNATRECCRDDSNTRKCAKVSTWYRVILLEARMEEVEAKGDEEDVKTVELRHERILARSLDVMMTRFPSDGACCAKVIAKVTSSAGVSEVIRRGCESCDKGEDIGTREGRRKEVGAVIETHVSEHYIVTRNNGFEWYPSVNEAWKVEGADRRSTIDSLAFERNSKRLNMAPLSRKL
jgi:hypothetical protein